MSRDIVWTLATIFLAYDISNMWHHKPDLLLFRSIAGTAWWSIKQACSRYIIKVFALTNISYLNMYSAKSLRRPKNQTSMKASSAPSIYPAFTHWALQHWRLFLLCIPELIRKHKNFWCGWLDFIRGRRLENPLRLISKHLLYFLYLCLLCGHFDLGHVGIVLYCIVLHCIVLHCIVLYCIVLYWPYRWWFRWFL